MQNNFGAQPVQTWGSKFRICSTVKDQSRKEEPSLLSSSMEQEEVPVSLLVLWLLPVVGLACQLPPGHTWRSCSSQTALMWMSHVSFPPSIPYNLSLFLPLSPPSSFSPFLAETEPRKDFMGTRQVSYPCVEPSKYPVAVCINPQLFLLFSFVMLSSLRQNLTL